MLQISLNDRKRNEWIRQKTKVVEVTEKIRMLNWIKLHFFNCQVRPGSSQVRISK